MVPFCKGLPTINCTNIFGKDKYIQYIYLKVCEFNILFRIALKFEKNVNLQNTVTVKSALQEFADSRFLVIFIITRNCHAYAKRLGKKSRFTFEINEMPNKWRRKSTDFIRRFFNFDTWKQPFCQMQHCASPAQSMRQDLLTGKTSIFQICP